MLVLSRLQSLASKFNQTRNTFRRSPSRFVGIDIGVRDITVASIDARETRADPKGGLSWQTTHRCPTAIDPISAPTPDWISATIESLLDHLPRCVDGENNLTALSLPVPWVHYQVALGHDLQNSQLQCDDMFRNSIFQSPAQLAHWPVVGYQHGQPNEDDQYVVSAVAQRAACQVAAAVGSIGYNVQSILSHGVALIHAAQSLTSTTPRCIAMLNRDGGSVAIDHESGCGLCRTLPGLPVDVLRHAGNGPLVLDDVRPWLSDIAAEITATIRYSDRANMCRSDDGMILVCGDCCTIPDLGQVLSKLTQRNVVIWGSAAQGQSGDVKYSSGIQPVRRCNALASSLAHYAMQAAAKGRKR